MKLKFFISLRLRNRRLFFNEVAVITFETFKPNLRYLNHRSKINKTRYYNIEWFEIGDYR